MPSPHFGQRLAFDPQVRKALLSPPTQPAGILFVSPSHSPEGSSLMSLSQLRFLACFAHLVTPPSGASVRSRAQPSPARRSAFSLPGSWQCPGYRRGPAVSPNRKGSTALPSGSPVRPADCH